MHVRLGFFLGMVCLPLETVRRVLPRMDSPHNFMIPPLYVRRHNNRRSLRII